MKESGDKSGLLPVLVATGILGVIARLGRVSESTAWITWGATGAAITLVVAFVAVRLVKRRNGHDI
jgi:hypothetical protein